MPDQVQTQDQLIAALQDNDTRLISAQTLRDLVVTLFNLPSIINLGEDQVIGLESDLASKADASSLDNYLPLSGGIMTGQINMGASAVTNAGAFYTISGPYLANSGIYSNGSPIYFNQATTIPAVAATASMTFTGPPNPGDSVSFGIYSFTTDGGQWTCSLLGDTASSTYNPMDATSIASAFVGARDAVSSIVGSGQAGQPTIGMSASSNVVSLVQSIAGTSGNIPISVTFTATATATGQVVINGTPNGDDTVTVGGATFTYNNNDNSWIDQNGAEWFVSNPGDQNSQASTLTSAINSDSSATLCSASATGMGGVINLTATTAGAAGNSIALSAMSTQISLTAFTGGVDADSNVVASDFSGGVDSYVAYVAQVLVSSNGDMTLRGGSLSLNDGSGSGGGIFNVDGGQIIDNGNVIYEGGSFTGNLSGTATNAVWAYNIAGSIPQSQVSGLSATLSAFASVVSPTFSGTVNLPKVVVSASFLHTPHALTFGSTVNTDASTGTLFAFTPTSNFTLANPTNPTDGQKITYRIKQDGTGSRVMTLGSAFSFGTDITSATLSTAANKTDYLTCQYSSSSSKWHVVDFKRGYA